MLCYNRYYGGGHTKHGAANGAADDTADGAADCAAHLHAPAPLTSHFHAEKSAGLVRLPVLCQIEP